MNNLFKDELIKNLEHDQGNDEKTLKYHEDQIEWLKDRINNREITLKQLRGES